MFQLSMDLFLIIALSLSFAIIPAKAVDSPSEVSVDLPGLGKVIGNTNTTIWTGKTYMQFRGIPYAEAPSGEHRFKASVARKPWSKPLQATKYGRYCPQFFTGLNLPGDQPAGDLEDCLTLNVFTKNITAKQPVMFYIHGGGLQIGWASRFPPNYLLEKDIVLVIIQYRIGVLGFSGTKTPNMPGNLGLMDIMLALEWVQKYISAFGGDKSQVTVFGQSSGANVISALLASPKTPPSSFARVIMQSDSAVGKFIQEPKAQVERICRALKCEGCEQVNKMEDCLKKAKVADILRVAENERFGLTIGDFHGTLPELPAELIKTSSINVPIMSGFTKDDGSMYVAAMYDVFKAAGRNFSSVTVGQFANGIMSLLNDTTELTNNVMAKFLFPQELWESFDHKRAIPQYFDLASTIFFKSNMIGYTNRLFAKSYKSPIYYYTFDYAGEYTTFGFGFGNSQYPFNGGVHHGDDLLYLFASNPLNAVDTEMAKKMVDLMTSFATNGEPKVAEGPLILPMKNARGPYFHINQEFKMDADLLTEFTVEINDPENKKLDRPNKPF